MLLKACTVELDGVSVPLLLDTGAAVSLLILSTVQWLFPHVRLTTPSSVLCGYGNSKTEPSVRRYVMAQRPSPRVTPWC